MNFSGVIPILITPFQEDGSVDYNSIKTIRNSCDLANPSSPKETKEVKGRYKYISFTGSQRQSRLNEVEITNYCKQIIPTSP